MPANFSGRCRWRAAGMIAFAAMLAGPAGAAAQLRPERVYYPVNRAIPMTIEIPAEARDGAGEPAGEVSLRLLQPWAPAAAAKPMAPGVVASAPAQAGRVDLAGLFPVLWETKEPQVVYAQLYVGERAVGPAVVLQPMLSPAVAVLDARVPRNPPVVFPPERQPKPRVHGGLRAYVDKLVRVETEAGVIEIALRPDAAPNTAWSFRQLVEGGFYDGTVFHRVVAVGSVAGQGFVIQGGDPTGTGLGGPGYSLDLEPPTLAHDYGVLSMARATEPNTAGSQFFVCLSRAETQRLDGQYCAFAEAVSGAEAIRKIADSPIVAGERDKPIKPPVIVKATLVDAPPHPERPIPLHAVAKDGGR